MPPQPYPTYPQYPQNQVNPSNLSIPQLQPPLQPLQLQNTPRPTQLPAQLLANPNNRAAQPAYNVEIQTYPTYLISTLPVQEVQLKSGRILLQQGKSKSTVVIEEELENEEFSIQNSEKEQPTKNNINIATPIILDLISKPQQEKEKHNQNL